MQSIMVGIVVQLTYKLKYKLSQLTHFNIQISTYDIEDAIAELCFGLVVLLDLLQLLSINL